MIWKYFAEKDMRVSFAFAMKVQSNKYGILL